MSGRASPYEPQWKSDPWRRARHCRRSSPTSTARALLRSCAILPPSSSRARYARLRARPTTAVSTAAAMFKPALGSELDWCMTDGRGDAHLQAAPNVVFLPHRADAALLSHCADPVRRPAPPMRATTAKLGAAEGAAPVDTWRSAESLSSKRESEARRGHRRCAARPLHLRLPPRCTTLRLPRHRLPEERKGSSH